MASFKTYVSLTKPGIIRGNALTATAGFFLASGSRIDFGLFAAMLAGLSLIVASGCVLNNYIDRGIDRKMERTKERALVTGVVTDRNALILAAVLAVAGSSILALFTNALALYAALLGLFAYVVLYGTAKRHTTFGTMVGSISGAMPPVVGYTAVSNQLDSAAFILFLILIFWQMPHFYAIAVHRYHDYKAAGIPVLPVIKGMHATKVQILLYVVGFAVAAGLLTVFGYSSYIYLVIALALSAVWLGVGLLRFKTASDRAWGQTMFSLSLLVITVLCVTISIDSLAYQK